MSRNLSGEVVQCGRCEDFLRTIREMEQGLCSSCADAIGTGEMWP